MKRMAKCHPDRPYHAHDMCGACCVKEWREQNPKRYKEYHKLWKKKNPKKVNTTARNRYQKDPKFRKQELKRKLIRTLKKFKVTESSYNMLRKQGCAVCGSVKNLQLDHDHQTGKLRGILCSKHNNGLGFFDDSIEGIKQAIDYLENYDYKDVLKKLRKEKNV